MITLPKRALDLAGQRFGELTAMHPVANEQRGVLWHCECDCGRPALRYAASLMASRRDHGSPACHQCLAEARRGRALARRARYHEALLDCWERLGTLYPISGGVEDIDYWGHVEEPMRFTTVVGWNETNYRGEDDARECRLADVAELFEVSRERIRCIEVLALQKLRATITNESMKTERAKPSRPRKRLQTSGDWQRWADEVAASGWLEQ